MAGKYCVHHSVEATLHAKCERHIASYRGCLVCLLILFAARLVFIVISYAKYTDKSNYSPLLRTHWNFIILLMACDQGNLWDPNAQVGSTPFYLAHQGGPDLELMASLAGVYDVAAPSLRYMAPHCHRGTKDSDESTQGKALRGAIRIGEEALVVLYSSFEPMREGKYVDGKCHRRFVKQGSLPRENFMMSRTCKHFSR